METLRIYEELKGGGEWLAAARKWMQSNIPGGDRMCWSSGEMVHVPFCKLEDFARSVAIAAVRAERHKQPND